MLLFSLFVPHTSLLLHTLQRWRKFFFQCLRKCVWRNWKFSFILFFASSHPNNMLYGKRDKCMKTTKLFFYQFWIYLSTHKQCRYFSWMNFSYQQDFWWNCVFSSVCHNELLWLPLLRFEKGTCCNNWVICNLRWVDDKNSTLNYSWSHHITSSCQLYAFAIISLSIISWHSCNCSDAVNRVWDYYELEIREFVW